MKPSWFDKITIENLPDNLRDVALEIADNIRPMLRKDQEGLAEKIGLEAIKVEMVIFEGTEPYWPQFDGDKFTDTRHEAIRSDYWKQQEEGTFELRPFLDKWGVTERTLRYIKNTGPDPRQTTIPGTE